MTDEQLELFYDAFTAAMIGPKLLPAPQDRITLDRVEGLWTVRRGDRYTDQLGTDEALFVVATLLLEGKPRGYAILQTQEEHDRREEHRKRLQEERQRAMEPPQHKTALDAILDDANRPTGLLDTVPTDPEPFGDMAALFGAAASILDRYLAIGQYSTTITSLRADIHRMMPSRKWGFARQAAEIVAKYWEFHRSHVPGWEESCRQHQQRLAAGADDAGRPRRPHSKEER